MGHNKNSPRNNQINDKRVPDTTNELKCRLSKCHKSYTNIIGRDKKLGSCQLPERLDAYCLFCLYRSYCPYCTYCPYCPYRPCWPYEGLW